MDNWNKEIAILPGAHIFQTYEWGSVKQAFGWNMEPEQWRNASENVYAAAMVLRRRLTLGRWTSAFNFLYCPRGPLLDWGSLNERSSVLNDLQEYSRKKGVIFIKIDPELVIGYDYPSLPSWHQDGNGLAVKGDLEIRGWKYSKEQVQFRNTVWINLNDAEDVWLARMKQKARYNLRLAEKKGVRIRKGNSTDFHEMYRQYFETSQRDRFIIRPESYYLKVWNTFMACNMAQLLIAEFQNEPIAGLFLFLFAKKAWFLYGMSSDNHREKMPNYLLQWHAMHLAKDHGCTVYDLWGAPEDLKEDDPLYGVYRFKSGLGGTVVQTIGAWDYTSKPQLYSLFTRILPGITGLMRQRNKFNSRGE